MGEPTESHNSLHDREAERAVLGALLVEPKPDDLIPRVISILGNNPNAFGTIPHQRIYDAILMVYDQHGHADTLTVAAHLKATGEIEQLNRVDPSGVYYLHDLQARIVETENTAFHAEIVRDKQKRRQLVEASDEIRNLAHDEETSIEKIMSTSLDAVFDLTLHSATKRSQSAADTINTLLKQIEERSKNPTPTAGIPTGFTDFDIVTNGLHPSNFIVVGGRPGQGKTSLVLNIAQNICIDQNRPVAIFSLEMTREELETRILASESHLGYADLRAGRVKDDQWQSLTEAAACIANNGHIIINDNRTLTLSGLKMEARHIKSRNDDLALVIVDYVQLLHTDRDYQNREREVADISRELKTLAYELDVPVIGCSQLNRQSEHQKDKRPSLANLRDSGALEQDADLAAFLHCDETSQDTDIRQLLILKNRNGPLANLDLRFHPQSMTFTNLEIPNARTDIPEF